jgi:hypothetical protein
MRRLAEQLIMPKSGGTLKQLLGGGSHARIPEDVVESGGDAPGAECVEEDFGQVFALVAVVLVPAHAAGCEQRQRGRQSRDNRHACALGDASPSCVVAAVSDESIQLAPQDFNLKNAVSSASGGVKG